MSVIQIAEKVAAGGEDVPCLPTVVNLGKKICEELQSERCDLKSLDLTVSGPCPFTVFLAHTSGNPLECMTAPQWAFSDPVNNVIAVAQSKALSGNVNVVRIRCDDKKCNVRLTPESLYLVVGYADACRQDLVIQARIEATRGWGLVNTKIDGKNVGTQDGSIDMGRNFSARAVYGESLVKPAPMTRKTNEQVRARGQSKVKPSPNKLKVKLMKKKKELKKKLGKKIGKTVGKKVGKKVGKGKSLKLKIGKQQKSKTFTPSDIDSIIERVRNESM